MAGSPFTRWLGPGVHTICLLFVIFLASHVIAQQYPFQDYTLPIEERADDFISRLTLQEKAEQVKAGIVET